MLIEWFTKLLILATPIYGVLLEDGSFDTDLTDSTERIGPAVAQVARHPYAASVLKNNSYACSAVILNTHWLMTISKCFDKASMHTYVYQRDLANYTLRVGSSYNHKGGSIYKIKILITNFDLLVTAVKAHAAIEFGPGVESANLPLPDAEPSMGNLATMVAWTPSGHLRTINAPVIQPSICDGETKLMPGQFICLGGVQDPEGHFCRKDTGGAIIQNQTLIGITTFAHSCALYSRPHAFPKLSAFSQWLDSVIWDESDRPALPTTTEAPTTLKPKEGMTTTSNIDYQENTMAAEPLIMQMELRDNSDGPRISFYETYLQHLERLRSSTTQNPIIQDESKKEVLLKTKNLEKAMMMLQPQYAARKYDLYDYTE